MNTCNTSTTLSVRHICDYFYLSLFIIKYFNQTQTSFQTMIIFIDITAFYGERKAFCALVDSQNLSSAHHRQSHDRGNVSRYGMLVNGNAGTEQNLCSVPALMLTRTCSATLKSHLKNSRYLDYCRLSRLKSPIQTNRTILVLYRRTIVGWVE